MSRQSQTRRRDGPGRAGARRRSALLRLSAAIAAAQNETEICQAVVNGLHDAALGYDFLGLFLLDPTNGERVLRASIGWPGVPANLRIPPGQGLSERPLKSAQLHYTPEVTRTAGYLPSLNSGSEVDVPLRVADATLGVLVVESSRPNAFGPEDFEILTAAANQTGIALARAQLVEEQRQLLAAERRRADEQQALLATITDLSAELELSRLLQAVLRRAATLLNASGGELAIYDEARGDLVLVANHNMKADSRGTRLKLGEGAMGRVVQTREQMIIPDYQTWSGRSRQYAKIDAHAVVVSPLLIGHRPVGAINVWHGDVTRTFSPGACATVRASRSGRLQRESAG